MRDLPSTLVEALKARAVVPFAGAGVSRAVTDEAGQPLFPTWRGLLLAAAERLRAQCLPTKANRVQATVDDNEYLDAAKVARDAMGTDWFKFLEAQFNPASEGVQPASLDLARAVWRLGSPLVVTTNYDKVLHWASPQERDLRHWTVSDAANLAEIHRGSLEKPAVWHLHGFIDRPKEIILTPDGYGKLYPIDGKVEAHYQAASWTLRHLLTARTFLFIGFGISGSVALGKRRRRSSSLVTKIFSYCFQPRRPPPPNSANLLLYPVIEGAAHSPRRSRRQSCRPHCRG